MDRIIDKISFPSNWNTVQLKEIGTVFKGKGVAKTEVIENGIPCVRYGELYTDYHFVFDKTKSFISDESASLSQRIENGDVLFAGSGETQEDIGKAAAYVSPNEAYAGGDIVILRPDNPEDGEFLGYLLNCEYVNQQKYQAAQGHSVVHFYGKNVEALRIVLPPSSERKKIARILRTWDKLIEQQTKLIAAKERQKKGLMQKLLSGELRFPGFEGEWETMTIGECCKNYSGGTPRRNRPEYFGGNIPWIKSGELNQIYINQTEEFITEDGLKNSSAKIVPKDTVLLALYGATAGVLALTMIEATLNQAILAIIPDSTKLTTKFLFYYLRWKMPNELIRLIQGGQPNLSAEIVKEITITVPNTVEQKKISMALAKIEEEIILLKNECNAIVGQKKGLMQRLLTGKIRVNSNQKIQA